MAAYISKNRGTERCQELIPGELPHKYLLAVGTTDFLTSAELNKSIFINC